MVLFAVVALAEEPQPEPAPADARAKWHRHTIAACLGNRCGGAGLLYAFRPGEVLSFAGGAGLYGVGLGARYHPIDGARSVYLGAGVSPIFAGQDDYGRYSYYGADATIGGEWRATPFYLAGDLGLGLAPLPLQGVQANVVIDLAIGVNFVRGR